MDAQITLIVPVYNVEKYVEKCLTSIVEQTYRNLEIILVDDGSTDRSGEICDRYAEEDKRIRVIHQENRGQSAARNVGLDISNGAYILFVDSDDYLEKEHISDLYTLLENTGADMSVCGYRFVNEKGETISASSDDGEIAILDTEKALHEMLIGGRITMAPWSKLYRRTLWENTRFPVGRIYEDIGTSYKILLQCSRIAVINKISYYYLNRPESTMNSPFSAKTMDALYMTEEMLKRVISKYPSLLEDAYYNLFTICITLIGQIDREKNRQYYEQVWKRVQWIRKNILCNKKVKLKIRVFAMISYLGDDTLYIFLKWVFQPLRKMLKKTVT